MVSKNHSYMTVHIISLFLTKICIIELKSLYFNIEKGYDDRKIEVINKLKKILDDKMRL